MSEIKKSTALRQSLPILLTSLVNKSGSIGISLLPILLVDGHYSTEQSTWVMSCVKGSTIVATLAAGWFSDSFGVRLTLLLSLLMASLGLGFMPLHLGYLVLAISGFVAQFGIASVNTTNRLLLTQTVDWSNQKEALGWMRFVNNLGQVLSFGLATMTASLGAVLLIWFDSFTSIAAFFVGLRILPKSSSEKARTQPSSDKFQGTRPKTSSIWPYVGCTLLLAGWNFMYEFFITGVAGRIKVIYPETGLRIFSTLMVLNTILCAALAVWASRILSRAIPSLVAGVLLTTSGLVLGIVQVGSLPLIFTAMVLLTLGEIIYGALAQFLLIRSVPSSNRENMTYSVAILIANMGRMAAAGLAFPLVVHSSHPAAAAILAASIGLGSVIVLVIGMRPLSELAK